MCTTRHHPVPLVPVYGCPCCGARSPHPVDIEHRYCADCHWFTGDPVLGPPHLAAPCPARSRAVTLIACTIAVSALRRRIRCQMLALLTETTRPRGYGGRTTRTATSAPASAPTSHQ